MAEKAVERLRKPEDGTVRKWHFSQLKGRLFGDVAMREETQSR
jgi:hypothetical protein